MINFDDVIKKHKRACPYWPQIADNPYNTLLIGDSESRKTNSLSNLIGLQAGIDKRYFYVKDHQEAKRQLLINKQENPDLYHFNDSKAFIEYSNDIHNIYMDDIYKNIEQYNPKKKHKISF